MTCELPDTIRLACPVCKRRLRGAPLYRHATECFRRTCRCGIVWNLILRPLSMSDQVAFHQAEWTNMGRVW